MWYLQELSKTDFREKIKEFLNSLIRSSFFHDVLVNVAYNALIKMYSFTYLRHYSWAPTCINHLTTFTQQETTWLTMGTQDKRTGNVSNT